MMNKRISKAFMYLVVIVITILFFQCGLNNGSPIKIKYAKRTQKLLLGSRSDHQDFSPVYPKNYTVLDLRINGIPLNEFAKIKTDSIYIIAGESHYPSSIIESGTIDGKEKMRICTIIPKNVLELTLYVGSYPPKTFKVENKIYDELADWEE